MQLRPLELKPLELKSLQMRSILGGDDIPTPLLHLETMQLLSTYTGMGWQDKEGRHDGYPRGAYCYHFDGADDYVGLGDTFQAVLREDVTIEVEVKPDDGQPATTQMLWGAQKGANNKAYLQLTTAGKLFAVYVAGGNTGSALTDAAVFANGAVADFALIKVEFFSTGIKIYKDGTEQALAAGNPGDMSGVTMSDYTSDLDLDFGASNDDGTPEEHFDGKMYNLKINGGADGWWACQEEDGTVAAEISGNNKYGKMYNITTASFHAVDPDVEISIPNDYGWLEADGANDYADTGGTTLFASGAIVPVDVSQSGKAAAYDSGGTQLAADYVGRVRYSAKMVNSSCVDTNGSDQFIMKKSGEWLNNDDTFTVAFRLEDVTDPNDRIWEAGGGTGKAFLLCRSSGTKVMGWHDGSSYHLWDGGGNTTIAPLSLVTAAGSHSIVLRGDGTNVHLYVNGTDYGYVTPATSQMYLKQFVKGHATAEISNGKRYDLNIWNTDIGDAMALLFHGDTDGALRVAGTITLPNVEWMPLSEGGGCCILSAIGNNSVANIQGFAAGSWSTQDTFHWNTLRGMSKSRFFSGNNEQIDLSADSTNYLQDGVATSFRFKIIAASFPYTYGTLATIETDTAEGFEIILTEAAGYLDLAFGSPTLWKEIKAELPSGTVFDYLDITISYDGGDKGAIGSYSVTINGSSATLTAASSFGAVANENHVGSNGAGSKDFHGHMMEVKFGDTYIIEDGVTQSGVDGTSEAFIPGQYDRQDPSGAPAITSPAVTQAGNVIGLNGSETELEFPLAPAVIQADISDANDFIYNAGKTAANDIAYSDIVANVDSDDHIFCDVATTNKKFNFLVYGEAQVGANLTSILRYINNI